MRFTFTEEQRLLQASTLDWLSRNYDFRSRAASVHRDGGSPAVWAAFADMGWLALPLPEEDGGFGGGPLEAGLLMQAFGSHLVVEPYHGAVLQCARLIAMVGTPGQKADSLPSLVNGSKRLALAHGEAGDGLPWLPRRTVARRDGDGWRVSGEKRLVVGAGGASCWLVSARLEAGGHALFVIDPASDGVRIDAYDTSDGARAANVHLDIRVGADALLGGTAAAVDAALEQVLAEGIVTHCWEAVGAMQAALEQTTQYTQQRKQFGQALSSFQVVQHRLAEMAVHCVEAQAACELGTMRMAQSPRAAVDVAAFVKSKVGRAARYVSQEAVQLHGAMGVCEELPIAATFRMLLAFAQKEGDPASHAQRLGDALLINGSFSRSQTLESRS